MNEEKKECSGGEEISITSFSKKEFFRLFFESIDERYNKKDE